MPYTATLPQPADSATTALADSLPPRLVTHPDTLRAHGDTLRDISSEAAAGQYAEGWTAASDTLSATATVNAMPGEPGQPVPHTLAHDDLVTAGLIACFIVGLTALARSREFIARQLKAAFRRGQRDDGGVTETASELRLQMFLAAQGALLLALLLISWDIGRGRLDPLSDTLHTALGLYSAAMAAFVAAKMALQAAVKVVFFDRQTTVRWFRWALFATAIEGALLFPVALLRIYFAMPLEAVAVSLAVIVAAAEGLMLWKCFTICFNRPGGMFQLAVYTALTELAPIAALIGIAGE